MRATLGESATETRVCPPSLDLVLFVFEVRMWRILDWPRLNLPVPVFLKRLAAPECVFNFGMGFPDGETAIGQRFSVYQRVGLGFVAGPFDCQKNQHHETSG